MSISSTASSARAAAPRRAGRVGAFALEGVFDRHQAGAGAVAPAHAEVGADVREQHDVDVLEHAGANEVGLGAEQLLGDARPELESCRASCRAP